MQGKMMLRGFAKLQRVPSLISQTLEKIFHGEIFESKIYKVVKIFKLNLIFHYYVAKIPSN